MMHSLNPKVLDQHFQKYENSCVPMAIEFVLKLMNKVDLDYYNLQDEKGDLARWGGEYENRIINGVRISMEFDIIRGPDFPIDDLFKKIQQELDLGRYVNCALISNVDSEKKYTTFHAYVIYGSVGDEFLGVTKSFGNPNVEYKTDMKSEIRKIGGTDILTFTI